MSLDADLTPRPWITGRQSLPGRRRLAAHQALDSELVDARGEQHVRITGAASVVGFAVALLEVLVGLEQKNQCGLLTTTGLSASW